MWLSDTSIKRPVLAVILVMTTAVLGLFSYTRLGIDNWPDVEFPFAMISVIYPGAGPEEMETQVAKPIEDAVTTIAGIRNITTQCLEGRTVVGIEFNIGVNIDFAALEVKDKVDAIRYQLPDDIEPPLILKFNINDMPIMNLAVHSTRPLEEVYQISDDLIRQRLSRVQGLAAIELEGGRKREIEVAISKSQLRAHNLSVVSVIQGLQMANMNLPSGRIEEGRRDVTIRLEGEYDRPQDMEQLLLTLDGGRTVRLRDLGQVRDSYEDVRDEARFNGEASVGLAVRKRSDANTVAVADGVREELERVRRILPADIQVSIARDNSDFIRSSLSDVWSNLMFGILLTALVLFLFTESWRGTVIAAIAMPISVIATFLPIDLAGFTVNSMTLMGLAISVGILVTNSIVVLENISEYERRGHSTREAASKGTSEIALAVAASTLTNIVVFVPIGFMGGIVGQFFSEFGFTVAFATVYSLLISFTLTPLMASRPLGRGMYTFAAVFTLVGAWVLIGPVGALVIGALLGLIVWEQKHGWMSRFFRVWNRFLDHVIASYRGSVEWAVNHRKTVMAAVTVLFFAAMMMFGVVGGEFFPQADQGVFYVSLKMPPGTRLSETDAAVVMIEDELRRMPEVRTFYSTVGRNESGEGGMNQGTELAGTLVQLVDREQRNRTTRDIMRALRPELADIPAGDIVLTSASTFGGGGQSDVMIEVTGDDMDNVLAAVDTVQAIVASTPGTVDVTNSWITGKPELKITPRREELADQGLSLGQVATTLRTLFEGTVATTYRQAGKEYNVRVRLDPGDRERLEQVRTLEIRGDGKWVPLTSVADVEQAEGPTTIFRKNKQRLVTVSGNLTQGTISELQKVVEERLRAASLPSDVQVAFGGESEIMAREFGYIYQSLLLAIILTYMLLAALLESYFRPLIIMATLPLGLIGIAFVLVLTDTPISMMVLMGMVMLIGIVVNNAILIIDYAQVLRSQGKTVREALLIAAPGRFRPIIMTNLATILGMMPLALGLGAGGEWRSPMAIASSGALAMSTLFTLWVIPVLYEMFEGRAERKALATK